MKIDLLSCINESFATYAGMTIMDRAIIDARDGLKPSARQCMYAQILDKITYKNPFKKSHKSVAAAMDHFYIHGDSSCYNLMVRMAQPYAMRYCLEDFDGQCGTITNGEAAAARYTEMRLGELGCTLYEGIKKGAINEWHWNYDDTEQFPAVVPSLGFYNIVNGTIGIATGLSSSIPQFNLKEVNEAMIKLLWNRDIDYDEIYCPPDFATGGVVLNGNDVKEILKKGKKGEKDKCGSIRLRSVAEYDEKENCIYFTEIPYGVYVETILKQLTEIINKEGFSGIAKINDLSTKKSKIKVVLEKGANPSAIIKYLFKNTSLEETFAINMTMLDEGKFPKVFGWREALLAHIDHEISCRTKIYNWRLDRIAFRVNIIDGLLKAIANIDEVVSIIKSSESKSLAAQNLIKRFGFSDDQTDAILKMTLSRLANLEIKSFKDEKEKLLVEAEEIKKVLNDNNLLYKEIEKDMTDIANKFGDDRRTKILNLDFTSDEEDAEPIEKKELLIYFTNLGNIYTKESSTLLKTKRGGKGSNLKLAENEAITKIISDDNFSSLLIFSTKGRMYNLSIDELPINSKVNLAQLFEFESNEKITTLTSVSRQKTNYFIFITKNGMLKKIKTEDCQIKRGKSIKVINLKDNDEVVNVMPTNDEQIGILTNNGNFINIETVQIAAVGRSAMGVKGIKLNENDFVIDTHVISKKDTYMLTLTCAGLVKKASMSDFPICTRATKGKKISEVKENDNVIKFLTLENDFDIIVLTKRKNIKISTSELRTLSRSAQGVKAIDLNENDNAIDLIKS